MRLPVKLATLAAIIGSLFAQSVLNLGIGLNYELNKKYISEHLCENRDKPCMHCNGKCYLNKQLQRENNERNKIPARNFSNEDSFVSDLPVKYTYYIVPFGQSKDPVAAATQSYSLIYSASILRPPLSA